MEGKPGFRRVRRFASGGSDLRREVDDEIASHLEHTARELMASGMDPREAEEEARRRFGPVEHSREACLAIDRRRYRARRRWEALHDLVQDLGFAVRTFRRSPVFVAGAILTLALGIGANTAVFSVVHGVLLKPLPFPEPERLVALWESNPDRDWTAADVAPANVLDWREQNRVFTDVTALLTLRSQLALTGSGEPQAVDAIFVCGNFFSVLGVPPLLGRWLRPEETWDDTERVVVLSHGFWRRSFGGDPKILGRDLRINARTYRVVGVMPPGFSYPLADLDVWIPMGWSKENRTQPYFRRAHYLFSVARLKPGVSLEQARADLRSIADRLEEQYPETNTHMGAGLTPLHEWVVGETRRPLLILLGAVGLVLLIACANVANLQLARATVRAREMALRSALGAGRGRLLRQLLTESLLLALLGGAAGVLLGAQGTRALLALAPGDIPRAAEIGLHPAVLLFSLAATVLTGLLFGLAPALRSVGAEAGEALRESRGASGQRGNRMRGSLMVAEVALAVVLAVGAALLAQSFLRLRQVDPGFRTENVLTAGLSLPGASYPETRAVGVLAGRLLERVETLPQVRSAAVTTALPLSGLSWTSDFTVEGWPAGREGTEFHRRAVSPGYFRTLGVPLLQGRVFTAADGAEAPPVVVINESLARRYFDGEDPVGRRVRFSPDDPDGEWATIVGVVGDEKLEGLAAENRVEILQPFAQAPEHQLKLAVRTDGDPATLLPALRAALKDLDRDLPFLDVAPLDDLVAQATARERFLALLMATFAGIALALAAVGVFALISYAVTQRTREIGIRMALGAAERQVLRLVIGRAMALVLVGVGLGAAGALAFSRVLQSLLFGVSAADPATFVLVAAALALLAFSSTYVPARRAAQVDPAVALRKE